MAINLHNFDAPIRVARLAADPSSPVNGIIYYNTTSQTFRQYANGSWENLGGSVNDFLDSVFRVSDDVDSSKKVAFEVSAVSTATTRTLSVPDANVDLGEVLDLRTLSGTAADSVDLGTFTGSTIPDSSTIKSALQSLETEVELKINASEKGAANGVATLDANSKIPASQIPAIAITDVYVVADIAARDALTVQEGDVAIVLSNAAGDREAFIYDGSAWQTLDTQNFDTQFATKTTDNLSEGSTNLYFTDARAKSAAVSDAIVDGVTDVAPSQNAVFDALALKLANVVEDTSPSLGGDLDTAGFVVIHDTSGLKRGSSGSSFIEEEYVQGISIPAAGTNVLSDLTFAHSVHEGLEVVYKIKESTTNRVRIGTLRVVTNGTDVSYADEYTQTAEVDVSFSAAINGANIQVSATVAGSNGSTMNADLKRIKA